MQKQASIADILRQGEAPALYKVEQTLYNLGVPLVESLVEILVEGDVQLRRNAAWLLRKYSDASVLVPLMNAIFDSDVRVRQYAAIALGALKDPEALEALLLALHDTNIAVRLNAVRSLGRIREPGAISYLLPILEASNEDTEVRAAAAQALGHLRAVAAIDALYNALSHSQKSIHVEASMALARIGEPALERLIEALHATGKLQRQRRRSAAAALGWMVGGGYLAQNPVAVTKAMEALVAEAGSTDRTVRYEIAQALAATNDYRALEPLMIGLRYDAPPVRRSAAKALKEMAANGRLSMTAVIEPLLNALDDTDEEVQFLALETLGLIKDRRVLEPLFNSLNHANPEIRYRAVLALGDSRDASVVKPLTRLLRDKDPRIRRNAALALGKMGYSRAIRPLVVALSDPEPDVRQWAAISLGQLGAANFEYVGTALVSHYKDPDYRVQRAVYVALLQMGVQLVD
jgi:HEAT repeat protein